MSGGAEVSRNRERASGPTSCAPVMAGKAGAAWRILHRRQVVSTAANPVQYIAVATSSTRLNINFNCVFPKRCVYISQ
jgi:hypothetical protein